MKDGERRASDNKRKENSGNELLCMLPLAEERIESE